MLFGLGAVPAIIATFIYAVPPPVEFITPKQLWPGGCRRTTDERVDWDRVNELGFRVLQKPFAPADLLSEVRLALEARR